MKRTINDTVNIINEYIAKFGKDDKIKKLEDNLSSLVNLSDFIYYAKNAKEVNFDSLENQIIESGNYDEIKSFASAISDIESVNISKLEDAICNSADPKYIYQFAFEVKNADINKLEDAVCKAQDAEYICYFARDIKGADIDKLQHAIHTLPNTYTNIKYLNILSKISKKNKCIELEKEIDDLLK